MSLQRLVKSIAACFFLASCSGFEGEDLQQSHRSNQSEALNYEQQIQQSCDKVNSLNDNELVDYGTNESGRWYSVHKNRDVYSGRYFPDGGYDVCWFEGPLSKQRVVMDFSAPGQPYPGWVKCEDRMPGTKEKYKNAVIHDCEVRQLAVEGNELVEYKKLYSSATIETYKDSNGAMSMRYGRQRAPEMTPVHRTVLSTKNTPDEKISQEQVESAVRSQHAHEPLSLNGANTSSDSVVNAPKNSGQSVIKTDRSMPIDHDASTASQASPQAANQQKVFVYDPPSNIREYPNGPILCKVEKRVLIPSTGIDNGWHRTSFCGEEGYIHNSQVK